MGMSILPSTLFMKTLFTFFLNCLLLTGIAWGQQKPGYKVGLFLPIHLDTAFTPTGAYRYGSGFPKQSLPGLEFLYGAEFAMEAFQTDPRANVQLHVFDIRSREGNIGRIGASPLMDSMDLIIGQVSGGDYQQLAQISRQKNIPFVSATFPNDGGVKSTPTLLIMNARLNTHIQTLYNHLLVNMGTDNIVWVRRPDQSDNRVADLFKQLNDSPDGPLLKYKTLNTTGDSAVAQLLPLLDSTQRNVVIGGSLDESFARKLGGACLLVDKAYPITLVGMPTWETVSEFRKSDYNSLPILYSSTFHKQAMSAWYGRLEETYKKKTASRPSDMTFKGFLATYHFVNLLLRHGKSLAANLGDSSMKSQTDLDFRPVRVSKTSEGIDYYENKRIYILKRENRAVSQLN
jgi:hypothetical protein